MTNINEDNQDDPAFAFVDFGSAVDAVVFDYDVDAVLAAGGTKRAKQKSGQCMPSPELDLHSFHELYGWESDP